jgi:hypothetical protein
VSRTELEFANSDVNSILPFANEVLTLQSDVEFYDRDNPDAGTAFTLQGGQTTVTLGGDGHLH